MDIPGGLLGQAIEALQGFEGKKPVGLAVRLVRAGKVLSEYHEAWCREQLNPAILAFNEGGEIPGEDHEAFIRANLAVFNDPIAVDIEPVPLADLEAAGVLIEERHLGLLMHLGIVSE